MKWCKKLPTLRNKLKSAEIKFPQKMSNFPNPR